jgi:hypothetical protein
MRPSPRPPRVVLPQRSGVREVYGVDAWRDAVRSVGGRCHSQRMDSSGTSRVAGDLLFYDREGSPIDMATWQRLRSDDNYRVLRRDTVDREGSGRFGIVSVFHGTDQGPLGRDTRPLVFGAAAIAMGPGRVGVVRELYAPDVQAALDNHVELLRLVEHGTFEAE